MAKTTQTAANQTTTAEKPIKPVKKPATKPAATDSQAATNDTTELRAAQIRILQVLAKATKPMSRRDIALKAKVDPTKVGDYADRPETQSAETKAKWAFPDLRTLEMIKVGVYDVDGRDVRGYTITAKGRKALVKVK
jgi:hypothetical protein